MSILQKTGEEIVPLSRKQNIVLLVIIASIFQFVLFYAPALADEAVSQAKAQNFNQEEIIRNESLVKEAAIDTEAAKITTETMIATPEDAAPATKILKTSTHTITAYNSEAAQTDDSPCITANGFNVCEHGEEDTIAANFLKFGTKVQIPELFGDRVFVVRDRMNARHANRVDIWMKERSDALKFGVKIAKIQVIE